MEYEVVETDEFNDWRENLRDLRIDYGPGYRLYYVIRGRNVVFLLCGGDKSTQTADIKKAVKLAEEV
ncbi:MAG: addiction module killer protein [Treponema sp.]|jgi:putative addiction module killer protein|nr:addiction module killer protein [Treponema sp.]